MYSQDASPNKDDLSDPDECASFPASSSPQAWSNTPADYLAAFDPDQNPSLSRQSSEDGAVVQFGDHGEALYRALDPSLVHDHDGESSMEPTVWKSLMVAPSEPVHHDHQSFDALDAAYGAASMLGAMGGLSMDPKSSSSPLPYPPSSSYDPYEQLPRQPLGGKGNGSKSLVDAVRVVGAASRTTTTQQQSQSSPQAIGVEPPLAPGGYLEPNYHVTSTVAPDSLFATLQATLSDAGVDFSVEQPTFTLKCVCYPNGGRLPFNVRVFRLGNSSSTATSAGNLPGYAVEFQRRSGCSMQFAATYRKAKAALLQAGVITTTKTKSGASKAAAAATEARGSASSSSAPVPAGIAFTPLPLSGLCAALPVDMSEFPDLGDLLLEPTEEECKASVLNLLGMARSDCEDVKVQAVQGLSNLALDAAMHDVMLSEGALDMMVASMDSTSECVRRLAVTGLANLTQTRKDCCQAVRDRKGVAQLLDLAVTRRDSCPQVIRESARAIANVFSHLGDTIIEDASVRAKLESLGVCEDRRTRQYMEPVQRGLGIAY